MTEKLDRYELLEQIGEGGFAVVYRARDTALDREVALKALKPVLLRDSDWVERFRREARVIARLDHTRIVPIYDVGEARDHMYIVMRLMKGPSLAELITTRGHLPWSDAVEIITAVADGLDYAHSQNVLHRDLKPANILIDRERGPALTDFGMAKVASKSSISATGDIFGTPHYIASEIWEGQPATPQADIFSLGCILFEMLTGEKIFPGDIPLAVMNAHFSGVEFPQTWPEGVPVGVAGVLQTALARDPAQRFATATEMVRQLIQLSEASLERKKAANVLEIFTFGGLRLRRNGEVVANVGSRRVEALLAYLACTGRPHPREVLADLLWDDRPQKQAMSNLRTILTGLRKQFGLFVAITRDTVGLDPIAKVWCDTEALAEALTAGAIEEVMELYTDSFLDGFYLRGARGFEDWLLLERESWQQQLHDKLSEVVAGYLSQHAFKSGIPIARRLLQFDPLLEEMHRQLMRLLALSGQRSAALAQYESCRQVLDEELGLEPADETKALYQSILAGELEGSAEAERHREVMPAPGPVRPAPPPAFLSTTPIPTSPPPLFVAREKELARLNDALATAVNDSGQVVLVTGEAGRGKTSLLAEFARRAQEASPSLIVVSGTCNAYSGLGDPYQPFREIMAMLTGDVEARWSAGASSQEQARRLWQLMPQTAQAVVERGPNLLDLVIPVAPFARRLASSGSEGERWVEQISGLVTRSNAAGNLEQRQIFDQVGQVLQMLAGQQPLLLILDDLQWADDASVSLLFHLARQLTAHRILIIGAYRPLQEQGASTPSHLFTVVAGEIKRLYGDVVLDLGQTPETEGRAFVDALLDSQPNTLSESFRSAMFRQTRGHPLFTVELLREMQERGDLIQDESGSWTQGARLDWGELPARVEAVIEQRLNRLDDDTQDMLAIAAVEGEVFTVQVVSRLHEVSERKLLRQLSRTLGKRHRLVFEQGEVTVGEQTLSRFQFRHTLFQQYLYNQLGGGERRLLHTEVAAVLEELYANQTEEITVALARHYTEAGQAKKAIPHLLRAGDQARLAYAHEAAIEHYRQAVIFLKEQEDDERTAAALMKLGLTYHNAFDFEQSRRTYDDAFALQQKVGQESTVLSRHSIPQVLRLVSSTIPTLDPTRAGDNSSGMIIDQLFSGLVEATPEMEVVPGVARRWEILNDGQKYIFHLRDDVFWSDGTRLSAADFEYAWKRVLSPGANSPAANLLFDVKRAEAFHKGETADPDQIGISTANEHTLVVELEAPAGYFLHLLTNYVTYAVPRHVVIHHGDAWTEVGNIATSGPFKLEAWPTRRSLILTRNPNYHQPFTGNVQRVEIFVTAEWSPSVAMYNRSQLDSLSLTRGTFSPEEVVSLRQRHLQDYVRRPKMDTICLNFNVCKPPFNNDRVRRALALAIDKETLANVTMNGLAVPAHGGFVPPGMPGHSAAIGLPFEPDRARRLLAEAGYSNGQDFPVVTWVTNLTRIPICEYLQHQWRDILGLKIEWDSVVWAEYNSTIRRIQPHLFMGGWSADYPDPDNFFRVGIPAETGWHNETYVELVDKARRITDRDARMELYAKADQLLIEEVPLLPLLYPQEHVLVKPWLTKFPATLTNSWVLKDAVIDPVQQPAQPQTAVTPSTPAPRTLRTTAEGEPDTLDPTLCADTTSGIIIGQLFGGLVTETPNMELVPNVAQRWEILEAGRKYIFHLRSDVTWSDDAPVTAADFEYAWKRVLNPVTGSVEANLLYDLKGASTYHQGQVSNPDSVGISVFGKQTLVIELERPTSYFLNLLVNPITFPVPQHVVEAHGESWTAVENIVTNGPFTLEAWRKGEVMSLRRNRAYHGSFRGNVERVEVFFSGDDLATELAWYEADRLDVARLPFLKREAKQQHGGEYISHPNLRTYILDFNKTRPPFDDPRVRRAFILATDRAGLLDTFSETYGVPATGGLCPPGIPGHSADIGLPFDPVQARQLLADAGYPAGHNFPKIDWLMAEFLEPLAGYLQEQWETNLGIDLINKKSASWGMLFEKAQQAQPTLLLSGWVADYPDPDNFLRVCLQHRLPGWQNERFDQLIEQARRITDQRKRIDLYQQADKILIEDTVLMPLTYGRYPLLVKPWVKQFVYAPHLKVFWQDIIIEPH